jgi:hypothetical protein
MCLHLYADVWSFFIIIIILNSQLLSKAVNWKWCKLHKQLYTYLRTRNTNFHDPFTHLDSDAWRFVRTDLPAQYKYSMTPTIPLEGQDDVILS